MLYIYMNQTVMPFMEYGNINTAVEGFPSS
jgi:hypothetical protein